MLGFTLDTEVFYEVYVSLKEMFNLKSVFIQSGEKKKYLQDKYFQIKYEI